MADLGRARYEKPTVTPINGVVAHYLCLNWRLVTFPRGPDKGPHEPGWQKKEYALAELIAGPQYGTITGHEVEPGKFLLDVDLDWEPGIREATHFFPPTEARCGRRTKPLSHLFYTTNEPITSFKFSDIDNKTVFLELRGTKKDGSLGHQTMIPPSVHPDTREPLRWTEDNFEPAHMDTNRMRQSARSAATMMLIAAHWPPSGRHELRMAYARVLLETLELPDDEATRILELACEVGGSDDAGIRDVARVMHTTREKLDANEETTGAPTVEEILPQEGKRIIKRLREWYDKRATRKQGGRTSAVTALINLVEASKAELFRTPEGDAHVTVPGGETLPLEDKSFRNWLAREYYKSTGRGIGGGNVADTVLTLSGQAQASEVQYPVYTRVAAVGGCVYLDLCRDDRHALCITADGFSVGPTPTNVRFVRRKGALPLPNPVAGERELPKLLSKVITLRADSDEMKLLIGWLIGALRGQKPYPILVVIGEQGSTKSYACRLARKCLDPSEADLSLTPKDHRDMLITALNSHVIGFDNLSFVPDWLSDTLCSIATGAGFRTRTLTTDKTETIFAAARPIVMNSIADIVRRGDLMDRAITISLDPLFEKDRRTEAEIDARFRVVQPKILAALADAVACALRRPVELKTLPRMADFAVTVESAAPALGWKEGEFLSLYAESRKEAAENMLEGDFIASTIANVVKEEWSGTCTELFELVTACDPEHRHNLPKSARGFSNNLRRLKPAMRLTGIDIQLPEKGHIKQQATGENRGRRIIRIVRISPQRDLGF